MNTRSKRQVFAGFGALQVKLAGLIELTLIQVSSAVTHIDHGPCGNSCARKLNFATGLAKQSLNGAFEAQNLFDKGAQVAIWIRLQLLPGQWIINKQLHAIANGIGGGFGATHKGVRHHLGVQFVVVKWAIPFGNDAIHHI